jgi:hypothetical protein
MRKSLATFQRRTDVELLPLYTTDQGGSVLISSDTWPDIGGALGLTQSQIAEARSKDARPPCGGGFAYMAGPYNALVEYAGNYPAERSGYVAKLQVCCPTPQPRQQLLQNLRAVLDDAIVSDFTVPALLGERN